MKIEVLNRYKSNLETSCWEWIGELCGSGYGIFRSKGKNISAHRYFYETYKGKIPKGLEIDHLCRNRKCVNPEHLEAVTRSENIKRAKKVWKENKISCCNGHLYTEESTYIVHGKKWTFRDCRICKRLAQRRYAKRKKLLKV